MCCESMKSDKSANKASYIVSVHYMRFFQNISVEDCRTPAIGGEWPSGLRFCNHICRIQGQTLLSAWAGQTLLSVWLGLGTQPCYEDSGDPSVITRINTQ